MYDIQFNGRTGTTVGVIVQNRPNIPAPEKIYDAIKIPGKDGYYKRYRNHRRYQNRSSLSLHFGKRILVSGRKN